MLSAKSHHQFILLYEENKNSLFISLMFRLNFQKNLTEDIFMEITTKAYEHFDQLDPKKASFKTWIFSIARNHLANHWRDKKELLSLDGLKEQGFEPAATEDCNDVDTYYEHNKIVKVLSLLSDKERTIIEMRFLKDMEFSDIVRIVKKSKLAIRTQLSRALRHFKYYYEKLYY
jgi:RNA polymerase sigma-70 factor (ECF subfamily)